MLKKKIIVYVLLSVWGTLPLFAKSEVRWEVYAKDLRMPVKKENIKKQNTFQKQAWESAGWHAQTKVKLTATDGKVYDQGNTGVFGALRESRNQKDKQDLLSASSETVQIVFPQYTWHIDKGEYSSDYRHWRKSKEKEKELWTFQVKVAGDAKLSKATFQLALEGVYALNASKHKHKVVYTESSYNPGKAKHFNLIDVDNQVMYFYDELKELHLSMEGKNIRTFRWVKGLAQKEDYAITVPEEISHETAETGQKRNSQTRKSKDEAAKDFIPDPPRDPNDHFGPPPAF